MRINPLLTQWKYLGNKTGSNSISLPDSFNELLCMVKINNNDNVILSIMIPQPYLTSSSQSFNSGYLQFYNGNAAMVRIKATSTSANLVWSYMQSTDYTSTSVTTYYYR